MGSDLGKDIEIIKDLNKIYEGKINNFPYLEAKGSFILGNFESDKLLKKYGFFLNRFNEFQLSVLIPFYLLDGTVYGFLIRSLSQKLFFNYFDVPLNLYGFDNFENYNDDKVVFLVEGIKDVLAVRKFYPFCLAYMTSFISKKSFNILENLFLKSNIIVITDSDSVGYEQGLRIKKKYGLNVYNAPLKDLGCYFDGEKEKVIVEMFINKIINFYEG